MAKSRNNLQTSQMLIPNIKIAVDYLVKKILEENKVIVTQIVYEAYNPVKYQRTNEFKEAWDTKVSTAGNLVEGEFKYDPRLLTVYPDTGQHSSIAYNTLGDPMTTYLADIVYQGLAGDFTGDYKYAKQNPKFKNQEWTKKRDAWNQLEKALGSRLLKQWMKEGFALAGLNVKAHGKAWDKTRW